MDIDLLGSFHWAKAAFEHVRASRGTILFVSAGQSETPFALQAHVNAAKAGVDQLMRTLAVEWAAYGVRVNSIVPGPTAGTEGMKRLAELVGDDVWTSMIPLGRYAELQEIAVMASVLISPIASFVNGAQVVVDGGMMLSGAAPFQPGRGPGARSRRQSGPALTSRLLQPATGVGNKRAFAAATAVLIVVTIGANMPPPLFPRYVDAYGLSHLEVTSIFATYTLFIVPALLVFGPLSDAVGRRPVLVVALVTAAAAAVVLGSAQSVWWLYVGRALQGISVGAIQVSAAAALADTHPRGDPARAAVAATIAICFATAVAPMTSGGLAQYLPAPLHLSFVVEVALVAMALTTLLTGFPSPPILLRRSIQISWPAVPAAIRPAFSRAAYSAVLAWVVTALFLALSPTILKTTLDTDNSVVSGGIVALMLGSSALVQLGGRGRDPMALQVLGLVLLVAGLGILMGAASTGSVSLCAVSAGVAGVGQGLAFSGAAQVVGTIAPSERRGNVMSLFFVAIYLGVTVAIVGVGFLSTRLGLLPAVQLFSVVASVGCVASIVSHIRASARQG